MMVLRISQSLSVHYRSYQLQMTKQDRYRNVNIGHVLQHSATHLEERFIFADGNISSTRWEAINTSSDTSSRTALLCTVGSNLERLHYILFHFQSMLLMALQFTGILCSVFPASPHLERKHTLSLFYFKTNISMLAPLGLRLCIHVKR